MSDNNIDDLDLDSLFPDSSDSSNRKSVSFDEDDGTNDFSLNESAMPSERKSGSGKVSKGTKKVAIVCGIAGFVIILVALFLLSVLSGRGKDATDADKQANTQGIESSSSTDKNVSTQVPSSSKNNGSTTGTVSKVHETIEWASVDIGSVGDIVGPVDAYLTVTSKRFDVHLGNEIEDASYGRCILCGNITGLQGDYEVAVNYDVLGKVNVGDVLSIKYTYVISNGRKIVLDVA